MEDLEREEATAKGVRVGVANVRGGRNNVDRVLLCLLRSAPTAQESVS